METFTIPFLHALVVSVSAGALIGLIRQWSDAHAASKPESSAGLRTFSMWSLVGFLSAYIHEVHASFFFPVSFATFGVLLAAVKTLDKEENKAFGLTSYTAALLTYLVGSMVYWQKFESALAVAVLTGILVASKPVIHGWTHKLRSEDIRSLLQFLAITGLILPLVPNQGYGPLEAFNPHHIWLMVVLISGLGFVGYVAVRLLGTRAGITVTGLAGGLASSTATTLALTRNSRETPEIAGTLAIGIIIANTVMIGRVLLMVLALNQELFRSIIVPLVTMALPTTLFVVWRLFLSSRNKEEVEIPEIHNPLSLKLAIKFALLYAVIVFLLKAVSEWGGGSGFYPVAFLSGLTDMDAIALSLTHEHSGASISTALATQGIVIGALANSLFKTVFAVAFGSPALRKPILLGMIPMFAAGSLALFWVALR